MDQKYQLEIDEFREHFSEFKNKRIIIYGIGRYTATLLEGVTDFSFVGLMDKNPENIGREMFGLPIVTMEQAEHMADLIVINTSETYWDVIYKRIKNIQIPVFYKNGKRAQKRCEKNIENPYKELSLAELKEKIEECKIISFDFYDTLFMRRVCNPRDVVRLLELEYKKRTDKEIRFEELRNEVKKDLKRNYTYDDLYDAIQIKTELLPQDIAWLKAKEKEFEKKLLMPRKEILDCFKALLESGREVYIISDMYLPKSFYTEVFAEYGISILENQILLSNELNLSKSEGDIWEYYVKNITKGQSALHIGDDLKADIEGAKRYGIQAYHTPASWDILAVSSMRELASKICMDYDSSIVGCVLSRILRDPYELYQRDGMICIRNHFDMGYCVFGPIILTFLLWLLDRKKTDGVRKLVFMSRDGYFLKEDFEYLCELLQIESESCYLGISRQLGMMASCQDKKDVMEYAAMPYSGSITELFEDRFGITGVCVEEGKTLCDYIDMYYPQIERCLSMLRNDYLVYLETMELDNDCAIVDLGYYGNNQRYLNKILDKSVIGYYFNANCKEENRNTLYQRMYPCFQQKNDLSGEQSQILKKMIYLESFLTAPYGMVKSVKKDGTFVCAPQKKNQEHFKEKEEINHGVKNFIHDYIAVFGNYELKPNIEFIDWYYGFCFSGALEFSEEVKQSFYNDNAMMNRIESMLFY